MLKESRHPGFQSCFNYAIATPKRLERFASIDVKLDILSISTPNTTRKASRDLQLWEDEIEFYIMVVYSF